RTPPPLVTRVVCTLGTSSLHIRPSTPSTTGRFSVVLRVLVDGRGGRLQPTSGKTVHWTVHLTVHLDGGCAGEPVFSGRYGRLRREEGANSTVTLLSVRLPSPGWEVACRGVPVVNAGLFSAAQHAADFFGDLARTGRVGLQKPREDLTHLRHG